MIKKIWKYLLGTLAGTVLCGAVIGGVVSCSNGNQPQTQTSQPTTTKSTTSTNPVQTYELANRYNTSAIAYKDAQTQNTSEISMVATNVSDYNTLISEPNNVIISVLGQPEAVINVSNDTPKTAPDITLSLNPNSTLYQEVLNGTNTTTDLTKLDNLISFSTTKGSKDKFSLNNQNPPYQTSSTYSLAGFSTDWDWVYSNTISGVGKINGWLDANAFFPALWTGIHAKTLTATFTTPNNLFWNNSKLNPTPFNLTIDLLPFIQFSNAHPTFNFNTTTTQKDGTVELGDALGWSLSGLPADTYECFEYQNVWYTNFNKSGVDKYFPVSFPYDSQTNEIKSVNYMYFVNGMIIVGTTAQTVI